MPQWKTYGNSRKVTQNPHFLKKCKRGTKEKFSKIAKKRTLVWKAQQHSGANGIILKLACTYSARTGADFGAKKRLQKCPNGQVIAIFSRSPKTRIFRKSAKWGLSEIFKTSPKKSFSLERPNSTLAEMVLSSNYNAVIAQRLEKIFAQEAGPKESESPSYGNFRKVTQNRQFLKKCKGGTKGSF